jgi:hypothetical protein
MRRNIRVQDSSAPVLHPKKAVQHAEGQRWHDEEIHSQDQLTVILQKSEPAFATVPAGTDAPQR